jgi:hypothetical protein
VTSDEITKWRSSLHVLVVEDSDKIALSSLEAQLEIALQLALLNAHFAAVEAAKHIDFHIPGVDGCPPA